MSRNPLLEAIEAKNVNRRFKSPKVGDTIKVGYSLKEGTKSRVQAFQGIVVSVSKKNSIAANFSVYRAIGRMGTLRKYLLHSPLIDSITVVKRGIVRKAKANHIVGKFGKSARVKSVQ